MINESRLLNEANRSFLEKDFEKALFKYSQLSSNFKENKEYPIYALFCDIASEDEDKALSLYEYFSVVKEDSLDEAIAYVGEGKAYGLEMLWQQKLTDRFFGIFSYTYFYSTF